MTIILVGLNHRTAPVELREQLALTGCALPMALEDLRNENPSNSNGMIRLQEAVILSTCNRLEIYAVVDDATGGWRTIETFIARLQNIPVADVQPYLYHLEGEPVVQHLLRVACGLDSMILGEPQILGQVTQAFSDAQAAGLTGPVLSHLLSHAIHTGKRARHETEISRYTTSVSNAGALLVLDQVAQMEQPNILIIGAGEMARLSARALLDRGIANIAFINRTYSRAETLAASFGVKAMGWFQLGEALQWADAIITATGAPHTVVYAKDVEQHLQADRKLVVVDIAVPRDVETTVGDLPGVQRYDIDDLQSIVDANTAQRQAAVPFVEAIIEHEQATFWEWYHSRQVTPVIQNLRRWANDVAQTEIEQALNRLQGADDRTVQVVERLAHRLVNKLLHEPTVHLRDQAADGNGFGYAHTVCELFGLSNQCDLCALQQSHYQEGALPETPEAAHHDFHCMMGAD
ncbi:MAG: glutamyl-tRNA reductase [Anaerolineae bacterium]|nr:glutamyl-tRNA reductase [Anaerolineae bacterium]